MHQLQVLNRSRPQRLRLAQADRLLWVWLSRGWTEWRAAVVIVKPETVIASHRRAFRSFWSWRSRRRIGRSSVPPDVRALIRGMSDANPGSDEILQPSASSLLRNRSPREDHVRLH